NQAVGSYQTISRLGSRDMVDAKTTISGYIPSVLGQEDLGWETSKTLNLGVDFGLLKDRINGNMNYFVTHTTDLLLDRSISPVQGLSSVTQNIGKTQNEGVELQLHGQITANKPLGWMSSVNASYIKNTIV